jgi:hypothetical protein
MILKKPHKLRTLLWGTNSLWRAVLSRTQSSVTTIGALLAAVAILVTFPQSCTCSHWCEATSPLALRWLEAASVTMAVQSSLWRCVSSGLPQLTKNFNPWPGLDLVQRTEGIKSAAIWCWFRACRQFLNIDWTFCSQTCTRNTKWAHHALSCCVTSQI